MGDKMPSTGRPLIDVTSRYQIRQTSASLPSSVLGSVGEFILYVFAGYESEFDSRDPEGAWELFYDGLSTRIVVATASLRLAVELSDRATLIVCTYTSRVEFLLLDEHRQRIQPSILSLSSSAAANEGSFTFTTADGRENCLIVSNGVDRWIVNIRHSRARRIFSSIPCIRWISVLGRGGLGSLSVEMR